MAIRFLTAFLALTFVPAVSFSQGSADEPAPSLGDLFKKVKEIKVPDSVSNLPTQITELKESYLETAKTVDDMRIEIDELRQEVYALRKQNEELSKAVGVKVEENALAGILKPTEISATNLVSAFQTDRVSAEKEYKNRYLKVVGTIDSFESGSQSITILLRSESGETKVKCSFLSGSEFFVDVLPSQGRLISRNDRRTLLTVGQPVAVLGTCMGASLNVEMTNCKVEGLTEMKKEEAEKK